MFLYNLEIFRVYDLKGGKALYFKIDLDEIQFLFSLFKI